MEIFDKHLKRVDEGNIALGHLFDYMEEVLNREGRNAKINDWRLYFDDGGVFWKNERNPKLPAIYATPFWEGATGITIESVDEDGNNKKIASVPFNVTGDMKKDFNAYVEAIKKELSKVK